MNINRESMSLPASLDVCKMRPTQLLTLAGTITGVALIALGISTGGFLGLLAFGVGAGLGYLSYNSFQVLTNLDQMAKAPFTAAQSALGHTLASTARDKGFFSAVGNFFSGQAMENSTHYAVGKNTLFFEFAVKGIVELLERPNAPDLGGLLDEIDNQILGYIGLKA